MLNKLKAPPTKSRASKLNGAKPKPAPDTENSEQRLGFLMHDVSRLRRTVFDDFMQPLGVTRSQWWVLAYVSRHDGMTQSDLANMLEIGKAALGCLIDRLESSGFVERRPDATDRRIKRIYLSDQGQETVQKMSAQSHEMSERILEGMSMKERRQLAEQLDKVKQNLRRIKNEMTSTPEEFE
ncbi:MarR family winged helix-turn-helix transcriptional regulator [Pseudomonas fluorescens]|uniref:Transcriptional regulator SlyA n=1 Tax=Pseudomonas fluorescens TaxID=294 RepID=A0A5E7C0F0_PSEFL|nr:MarR family transcriptional regulator [Pseudomonas fluorescens]VVN97916.1 Transcriptional regulator SlyA [Pseudomonas fluorescens]